MNMQKAWILKVCLGTNKNVLKRQCGLKIVILRFTLGFGSKIQQTPNTNMPNMSTYLTCTPIFEWYTIRCGSKNGHQKDTCVKVIGLSHQNMLSIPKFNSEHNEKGPI